MLRRTRRRRTKDSRRVKRKGHCIGHEGVTRATSNVSSSSALAVRRVTTRRVLINYRWGEDSGRRRGRAERARRGERRAGSIPPRAAPQRARNARAGNGRENRWHVRVLWWQLLVPPVEPGQRVGRLPMWVARHLDPTRRECNPDTRTRSADVSGGCESV